MCTLIGTSTNLVLNAQIEADPDAPLKPLRMFTMSLVGIPAAVVGILYLSVATPLAFRVIPEGQNIASKDEVEDSEAGPVHHAPQETQEGFGSRGSPRYTIGLRKHTAAHYNALHHTAPHYNALQHIAPPPCNTIQRTAHVLEGLMRTWPLLLMSFFLFGRGTGHQGMSTHRGGANQSWQACYQIM